MENFGLGDRYPLPPRSPNRSQSSKATFSFKMAGSDAVMLNSIQLFLSGLAIRAGLLGSAVHELKTISNSPNLLTSTPPNFPPSLKPSPIYPFTTLQPFHVPHEPYTS